MNALEDEEWVEGEDNWVVVLQVRLIPELFDVATKLVSKNVSMSRKVTYLSLVFDHSTSFCWIAGPWFSKKS